MTAQALWAAVHGVTSLFITMKGFPFVDRAALVDHTIDTLIAGLKAPSAAPPQHPGLPASRRSGSSSTERDREPGADKER